MELSELNQDAGSISFKGGSMFGKIQDSHESLPLANQSLVSRGIKQRRTMTNVLSPAIEVPTRNHFNNHM